MTSDGSPYARLTRAIRVGNLAIIEATAAALGWSRSPTHWRSCW
jgi:hypothetical protein